tara:strand:- start:1175 stop:1924 length:750 start_codon:yes stop_codon:yes gene_type:complete
MEKNILNQKTYFVTYGDKKFKLSRKRIINEAKQLDFFNECIMETEAICNDKEFNNVLQDSNFKDVFSGKRGDRHWIWKPYVVYKNLKKLKEEDILIYTDAGSTLPPTPYTTRKLKEYINTLNTSKKGILVFRSANKGGNEDKRTKGDVFKHFNALNDKNIWNTRQYGANRIIIKKNTHSMKLITLWWETSKNYPHLFSDAPSITKNHPNFKINTGDQSVWSLICKTQGVEEEYEVPWGGNPIKLTKIRK